MKAIGSIGAVTTVGGAGLLATMGGASATAGGKIENPETAVSDDGTIKWVATQTTGRVEWDGFDTPAKYVQIIVDVELYDQDGNELESGTIHDTGIRKLDNDSWGGEGEEVSMKGDTASGQEGYLASDSDWGICQRNGDHIYNDGYGLPSDPLGTSHFSADEDGTATKTDVVLKSTYQLYDANEDPLTGTEGYPDHPQTEAQFTVTVENQQSSTEFGTEDGDGDTDDSASVGV